MVKKLLIYCFAFLPLLSFSQPINSWPTENALWSISSFDENNYPNGGRTYHLDTDTIIQGLTYQKVAAYNGPNPGIYLGAVRADSLNRVYSFPKDSTSEVLLYDFNAQVGDTIRDVHYGLFGSAFGLADMVVISKDTILLQDGPHMRMFLENSAYALSGEVIDGVGAIPDFFVPSYSPSVSGYDVLDCMSNDSVSVIGGNCLLAGIADGVLTNFEIYPNPATDKVRLDLESPNLVEMVQLMDVRGALVKRWNHLPPQIDIAELPTGLYLLTVSGDGLRRTKKIVKR